MLSVLIPVYNYDVQGLVTSLISQAKELSGAIEVIVMDDASDKSYQETNRKIEVFGIVRYIQLEQNIGRSAIRNKLAREAQYHHLLYLDSDSKIIDEDYLSRYCELIKDSPQSVIYGGRLYQNKKPNTSYQLHWHYGRQREAIDAVLRMKNPAWFLHSSNLLLPSAVMIKLKFDTNLMGYGYEDIKYGQLLIHNDIKIYHIDNPVLHDGLKSHDNFIADIDTSILNLANLYQSDNSFQTRLIDVYEKMSRYKLNRFICVSVTIFKPILRLLLKVSPSQLWALDLYKYEAFDRARRST